jgi:hypothetical protein
MPVIVLWEYHGIPYAVEAMLAVEDIRYRKHATTGIELRSSCGTIVATVLAAGSL